MTRGRTPSRFRHRESRASIAGRDADAPGSTEEDALFPPGDYGEEGIERGASRSPAEPGQPVPGALVEFVRLIILAIFALGGWQVAAGGGRAQSSRLVLGVVLGAGIGYVLGGIFGRRTASAVGDLERELHRVPAAEILAGTIGLVVGLVVATLVSLPLFHLPSRAAYPAVAFVYLTFGYVGYRVGRMRSEEIFALFGVKPRAAGMRLGDVTVLDTSALLDGRLLALVRLGFLSGTLLVSERVLDELQSIADSSNASRRTRGRRGLDLLLALKRDPSVDVVVVPAGALGPGETVDGHLVRLARERSGVLLTNDSGLAKVAAALEIPVRSINELAEALRPPVVAGEEVEVRLARRGRDSGQAIGYLDDGTMVVVEEADHLVGDTVPVAVTNTLQTSTGQMVFGRVAEPDPSA